MSDHYASDGHDALVRLKEEISRLTEQQTEALKMATFLGMTTAEAEAYDARRVQITQLVRTLAQLSNGEPSNGTSPSNVPNINPEVSPSKTLTPSTTNSSRLEIDD